MAFSSKTSRLLVLLQITLFVVSALIMPRSVCHGAIGVGPGYGYGPLDPNRPACIHGPCQGPGRPYIGGGAGPYNRPGGGGGPGSYYPAKPAPSNGEASGP